MLTPCHPRTSARLRDMLTHCAGLAAGGEIWLDPGQPLKLRIFIDGSAVEIFTNTGQALATRLYRGRPNLPAPGVFWSYARRTVSALEEVQMTHWL